MPDDTLVVHVAIDLLGGEQDHRLGVEAPEGLLEGGPLGIDHRVFHAGAKHSQAYGGEVAIIPQLLQLVGRQRPGQEGLHGVVGVEAVANRVLEPAVIKCHGGSVQFLPSPSSTTTRSTHDQRAVQFSMISPEVPSALCCSSMPSTPGPVPFVHHSSPPPT